MTIGDSGGAPIRSWRPAGAVIGIYLLCTLPVLVLSDASSAGDVWIHVAALMACTVVATGIEPDVRGATAVADWLPILLVPWLYSELPLLIAAGGVEYQDASVQALELSLFPSNPSRTLAARLPWTGLSEVLHAAYFLYYPLIYVPPAVLYFARRRSDFALLTLGLTLAFATCFAVFIVYPVQGPRYLWVPAVELHGPVRRLVLSVLEAGSSRGAAFPSSHVAVAVVQSALCWLLRVPGWQVYPAVTLGLAIGAVYGGFHYAVDAVAGAVVGAVIAVGAPAAVRGFRGARATGIRVDSQVG